MIPAPFRIYADFECLLKEVDSGIHNHCFSYTAKYQDHIPCSFAYKLVCVDDKYSKDIALYRGKNSVYKFIQSIFNEYSYCKSVMKKHINKNLIMSAEKEEEEFEKSNICWICGKIIDDNKVRDHCHITGKYRGSCHWSCNINLKVSKKLPVIFHNLKGYDSHLIFKELSKFNCNIDVIPNGLEKYMSFTLNKNIVFIDSMLFMNSSLDKLVNNLNDFVYLSKEFKDEQLELVKRKGVYPYQYMNSFKRFKEDKLPDKDCFFNYLRDCCISEEEYQRACNVWKVFDIKYLAKFDHDLYLKTDALMLCDVFEKFIDVCLKDYGLDPCYCYNSPGLSWDAMLKMTGIKLEKIHDIDMYLFFEKGMRGGVSYISRRYSKSEKNIDIMYWDMNNLHGTVMSLDYLPYGGFRWLSKEEIKNFDLDSISEWNSHENSKIGYILEVDLEYCKELHNIHNDYSLCPEHISVSYEMLSNYCKDIVDGYNIKVGDVKKLIPNLYDKISYPVHYKNLIYYLSLGVKLKKIH